MTAERIEDFWLKHAIQVIEKNYGDRVSIAQKGKDLLKFGRTEQAQTGTKATLMTLPTGTYDETYVSANSITTISSSNNGDTQDVVVEGHTISGSDFTFVSQTITLTGQTQASLTTPLARATRIYNNGATDLAGAIYVYEDDTSTAGVPDTAAGVHLMTRAGENNSEKCSTTLSSTDYWIVTGAYADVLEKTAATAEVMFEIRESGKVFRELFEMSCSNTSGTIRTGHPYVIVRPNSDVRLRTLASANGTIVSGGIFGVLATTNTSL